MNDKPFSELGTTTNHAWQDREYRDKNPTHQTGSVSWGVEKQKIWIYQVSESGYGSDSDTVELFSTAEKAIKKHPGNWVRDRQGDYSRRLKDDPYTSISLYQCDVE